jgi:hypothetical protein
MIIRKKINSFLISSILIFSSSLSYSAQPSNEVQLSGPEKDLAAPQELNEFPPGESCEIKPKDGCATRLICYSSQQIFSKNTSSINAAVKRANMSAKAELTKLLGEKMKVNSICKDKEATYMKDGKGTEQIGHLCDTLTSSDSDAYLVGVEGLATNINLDTSTATVVIGQRCSGIAAAKSIRQQSGNGPDSPPSDVSSDQKANPTEALPGTPKSQTYKRNDF